MKKQIYHLHHLIPKHAGGTDDPSNLVELTIEEHAEAHCKLYEEYGRWQDRVAWLSLSGIMKDEERIYEICSNSNKGNPTNYTHSDNIKLELSEMRMGENNPMYGLPAPNRGIKRPGVGGRKKGTVWSEEERQSQMYVRSQPGYYDYLQDPERRRKISESNKGRQGAAKGKYWFNNGVLQTYAFKCPDGYVKGRLPCKTNGKKGMKWYNNGIVNKQFRDNNIEEGFVRGKLCKK